jgi:hypothetical protein
MADIERLWTVNDLASFFGYSVATVRSTISRAPTRLPPRVAGLHLPRWEPGTVKAWAMQQSRPAVKQGCPRATRAL